MKHLQNNSILADLQHGFRKHRSCQTQLIKTVNDLAKSINHGEQIDSILIDFSKAFDKVCHQKLLIKLEHYGIGGRNFQQFQITARILNVLCTFNLRAVSTG